MKKYDTATFLIAIFLFSINSFAKCKEVYTIGAYDEAFKNHATVTKLGVKMQAEPLQQ